MRRAANPMRRSWLDDSNGGWLPHRLQLVTSPAWRMRTVPLSNLLERIEIEHMRHAGQENGRLCVSYDQFVAHGVSRKIIRPTINLGIDLGLLDVGQSDEWQGDVKAPNHYRLTYVPEKGRRAPSDEWASVTEAQAAALVAEFQAVASARRKSKSQFPFTPPTSSPFTRKGGSTSSPFTQSSVPLGEHTLISGGNGHNSGAAQAAEEAPAHTGRDHRSGQASGSVTVGEALSRSPILASLARGAR